MDTTQRTRYEVPALILVDALDEQDAWTRARNLSATIDNSEGPGAFFHEIGVAPINQPREAEDLEGRSSVSEHVESIRSAVGDEWPWRTPREAGDMSTSDGLGGDDDGPIDPRRDEDNQAALDAGIASDYARESSRRQALIRERVDWLCREGWEMQAGDYRRGDITLTELLRRLHDVPAVVEQVATWLEEDAAEEAPVAALRRLREWFDDPETDGEDVTDAAIRALDEAGI